MLMENNKEIPRNPRQTCFPATYESGWYPADPNPLDDLQLAYLVGEEEPSAPDGMVSTINLKVGHGIDYFHAPVKQPDDVLFEYDWSTRFDPTSQCHLDATFMNNPVAQEGARHGHSLPRTALAVPGRPSQDESGFFLSTQVNRATSVSAPGTRPFRWERSVEPPSVFRAFAPPGHQIEFPLLFPTIDAVEQGMQDPHLDSQIYVLPEPKADPQETIIRDPPGVQPHAFTNTAHESDQGDPLTMLALPDLHKSCASQLHDVLEDRARSYGRQTPTRTYRESMPERNYLSTFQPYPRRRSQRGVVATFPLRYTSPNNVWSSQYNSPAPNHDYIADRRALPATIDRVDASNIVTPSLPPSDDWNSHPSPPSANWDGGLNPILDNPWGGQLSAQSQPQNHLPTHTPPVEHGVPHRQEAINSSSAYSGPDGVSPSSLHTTDGAYSVASSAQFADEERQRLSLAPGIHSWTTSTAREHLERVLGWSSPLTNTALIKLFLLIMESPFIRAHEMEPTIDSQDGQALLKQVQCLPDCPRNLFDLSESSVLTLFAAHPIFRCLICGNPKQSMTRVTGCIRSHLDHRPYACHGDAGCETCPKDRVVMRFFTLSLLYDHRREKGVECTACGNILKSSMKRHWGSKHRDTPFPYDHYPGYRNK